MKDQSIYVDPYIFATTYIAYKCIDTVTFKTSTKFYKTPLPFDMIVTKYDASTGDEQVEKFTK